MFNIKTEKWNIERIRNIIIIAMFTIMLLLLIFAPNIFAFILFIILTAFFYNILRKNSNEIYYLLRNGSKWGDMKKILDNLPEMYKFEFFKEADSENELFRVKYRTKYSYAMKNYMDHMEIEHTARICEKIFRTLEQCDEFIDKQLSFYKTVSDDCYKYYLSKYTDVNQKKIMFYCTCLSEDELVVNEIDYSIKYKISHLNDSIGIDSIKMTAAISFENHSLEKRFSQLGIDRFLGLKSPSKHLFSSEVLCNEFEAALIINRTNIYINEFIKKQSSIYYNELEDIEL